MADKPTNKNGSATAPRAVPDPEPTPDAAEVTSVGTITEPRVEYIPADLPVIERNEVTNAVAGAIMGLGEEAAGVGDLVTVGSVDAVMAVLLERGLTTPELATPKVGYFRDLRGRVAR